MFQSLLISMLFLFVSCSEPMNDSVGEVSSNSVIDKDRSYSFNELTNVCVEGCLYHDKLYRGANKIQPNAVSLNNIQLDSIIDACSSFCQDEVFRKINQKNNRKAISEIDVSMKKEPETAPEKIEEKDDIEYDFGFSNPKPQKKEEIKKDNSNDSSLKPFEDL
jgi:hypothetical protein